MGKDLLLARFEGKSDGLISVSDSLAKVQVASLPFIKLNAFFSVSLTPLTCYSFFAITPRVWQTPVRALKLCEK